MTLAGWTCPDCGRLFGRTRQGHECAPAMSLDEYLATGPPHEAPIVDAVLAALADLDVHVEPVSVGVLLKRPRMFAQLRPMARWEAVSFVLGRTVHSPRISRKVLDTGSGRYHVVNVRTPAEVDDQLVSWLVEAYVHAAR
ncbi:MAG: DUF5655 domain-containing protein [Acidimicrobiia bacterium]